MFYLLPTVLDIVGINTSSYYEYMIDLSEKVPVLYDDIFSDDNGSESADVSGTDYTDEINNASTWNTIICHRTEYKICLMLMTENSAV